MLLKELRAHVTSFFRAGEATWAFFLLWKYTFLPAELSSERGEKEVLADSNQPTAPPSTKSHVSYCAARARRREKMAAEGTSSTTGWSLLQSVLVSAVDSCHCPHPSHPLYCSAPHCPSLSPTRFDAFKDVIVWIVHNMLPILSEQTAAPRLSASLCGFSLWLVGFPVFRLGDWFT